MTIELKVPQVGESITEVTIDKWLKSEGEAIERDSAIAILESEKATVELPAEASGTITKILKKNGEIAQVGEVIAVIDTEQRATAQPEPAAKPAAAAPARQAARPADGEARRVEPAAAAPSAPPKPAPARQPAAPPPSPKETPPPEPVASQDERDDNGAFARTPGPAASAESNREEEVVGMTRLRRTLAKRLVEAQKNAALLTTFNEADMSAVMALRKEFGEIFLQKYQVKLGFMSFFVKAAVDALKLVPQVNGEIRGDKIVYRNYYDIAVAIGGGKGLVVPVLRNVERMSFAEVEVAIADFAKRARENTLKPDELQGGTFTISNGGIYGSLLSTPIVNPPQSGILGMHTIQERPVARDGQVVIRPMMYLALTYDHRLVDGREAVTFLKRIKDAVEQPTRMLIEI